MLIDPILTSLHRREFRLISSVECGHRWLLLVYRPAMLAKQLQNPAVHSLLSEEGYPLEGRFYLNEMIAHLRKRLLSSDGFPHEIGIFLGYPLEDVIDFADTKEKDASFAATGRYTMMWNLPNDALPCLTGAVPLVFQLMAGTPFPQLVCNVPQAA